MTADTHTPDHETMVARIHGAGGDVFIGHDDDTKLTVHTGDGLPLMISGFERSFGVIE